MEYVKFKNLEDLGIMAIHTTSLLGDMKNEDNLNKLLVKLNIPKESVVKGVQTHSTNILCLEDDTDISNITDIDGYIAKGSKYTLVAYFADCLPIYVFDKKTKVFALLHGGWRGSSNGILRECIRIMKQKYMSKVEDIVVTFGVGIAAKDYEIKEDTIMELKKRLNFDTMVIRENGKTYLDNQKMNKEIALKEGVLEENIYTNSYNTYDSDFYSYRKNKTPMRNISLVRVEE